MTNKLSGSMIREIKFKIHDRIYAASNRNTNGWSRELNYVSWGDVMQNMISGCGVLIMARQVTVLLFLMRRLRSFTRPWGSI